MVHMWLQNQAKWHQSGSKRLRLALQRPHKGPCWPTNVPEAEQSGPVLAISRSKVAKNRAQMISKAPQEALRQPQAAQSGPEWPTGPTFRQISATIGLINAASTIYILTRAPLLQHERQDNVPGAPLKSRRHES